MDNIVAFLLLISISLCDFIAAKSLDKNISISKTILILLGTALFILSFIFLAMI